MWLMACQILGPRDLKFGMPVPLDPWSDWSIFQPQGGGGFLRLQDPKKLDLYMHKVVI